MKAMIFCFLISALVVGCAKSSDESKAPSVNSPAPQTSAPESNLDKQSVQDSNLVNLSCPKGQFVVGIFGQAGWWIDQLGVRCSDSIQVAPDMSDLKNKIGTSEGGDFFDVTCPQGTAVSAVDFGNDRVCSIHETCLQPEKTLNNIKIVCSNVNGLRVQESQNLGGHYHEADKNTLNCQAGFVSALQFQKQDSAFVGNLVSLSCQ